MSCPDDFSSFEYQLDGSTEIIFGFWKVFVEIFQVFGEVNCLEQHFFLFLGLDILGFVLHF